MRFAHPRPEDEDREFVLQFYLGDDSLSITEKKHRYFLFFLFMCRFFLKKIFFSDKNVEQV